MSPFKSHAWYAKCHTDHSQVQVAPVDEVNEAPRCPNRHVDPATQLPDLLPNVHTFTHMRTVRRQELPQSKHIDITASALPCNISASLAPGQQAGTTESSIDRPKQTQSTWQQQVEFCGHTGGLLSHLHSSSLQ